MPTHDLTIDIDRISAEAALPHWQAAEHTAVFTHPQVLGALAHEVHWWLATESGRPACLWPVCVDGNARVGSPEFGYYVGPFDVQPEDPSPRHRLRRAVVVRQRLLEVLAPKYDRLLWSTFPGHVDLRPWLWFEAGGRCPVARPRYTAVISGIQSMSDEDLMRTFRTTRRNDVRQARRANAVSLPGVTLARVQELYCGTLAATGAEAVARRRLGELETLYRLVHEGHGMLVACGLPDEDVVRSVTLILLAKGRACEVVAASDTLWRDSNFIPFTRMQALAVARAAGARSYDFNGANSLHRALDKHSYGAEAELYFDISW